MGHQTSSDIFEVEIRCYFILSRKRLDACDFAANFIPASGGPHMDLGVVLQTLRKLD